MGGCCISWTIRKSFTPHSRQITMPVPYQSVFTGWTSFLPPSHQHQSTEGTPMCRNLEIYMYTYTHQNINSHTHTTVLLLFWNLSGTTRVSRYQKGLLFQKWSNPCWKSSKKATLHCSHTKTSFLHHLAELLGWFSPSFLFNSPLLFLTYILSFVQISFSLGEL